jgi:hypothetical protein
MAEQGVGFKLKDFVESGFLSDIDVRIVSARFGPIVYTKKDGTVATPPAGAKPRVGLILKLTSDALQKPAEQSYPAGSAEHFVASADGKKLLPTTQGKALPKDSTFMHFMASVYASGYPEDLVSDDISFLDGVEAHMITKEVRRNIGGEDKNQIFPVIARINNLDEIIGGGGKKTSSKSSAPAELSEEVLEAARDFGNEALAAAEGNSFDNLNAFANAVFGLIMKKKPPVPAATRNAVQKALKDASFVEAHAESFGWVYSDGAVAVA